MNDLLKLRLVTAIKGDVLNSIYLECMDDFQNVKNINELTDK